MLIKLIKNQKKHPFRENKGFTLVEMVISVGIFAMVMVVVVGSLLQIVSANHQAQAIKTILDNVNFALEDMTRNIKNGSSYRCSQAGQTNCGEEPTEFISIVDNSGVRISYSLGVNPENSQVKSIFKTTGTVSNPIAITPPNVNIDRLHFFLKGVDDVEDQPNVFVIVGGAINYKKTFKTRFDVETFITQRSFIRS